MKSFVVKQGENIGQTEWCHTNIGPENDDTWFWRWNTSRGVLVGITLTIMDDEIATVYQLMWS